MEKKNLLIIIPARSGSKGLKNKNILKLNSKPLISYSISIAKKIKEKSKVIFCSTDSKKIKNIIERYKIDVPFLRPKKISKDLSTDITFVNHTLKEFSKKKIFFNIGLILRPTSPFRNIKNIEKGYSIFKKKNASSMRAICYAPATPYKMWKFKNGIIKPILKTNFFEQYNLPRQKLPQIYWQCGNFEYFRIKYKSKIKSVSGNKIMGYVVKGKETIDIDTFEDLKKAIKILKK
ncbi:acylneuraminate cytidylyltransferase family protein [Pelagibacterales bacterium SAG-MED09]|nr:acylneuraminate cytidylyltransferase family protein [Pelagibacterales bacterium SAG-MED09]